jgi:hypothetical protein
MIQALDIHSDTLDPLLLQIQVTADKLWKLSNHIWQIASFLEAYITVNSSDLYPENDLMMTDCLSAYALTFEILLQKYYFHFYRLISGFQVLKSALIPDGVLITVTHHVFNLRATQIRLYLQCLSQLH